MADLVVHHRGLAELFREPAERLREFTAFELAPFVFHDSSRDVMRVHVFEGSDLDLAAGTLEMKAQLRRQRSRGHEMRSAKC
jgi:hypothetical protein